MKQGDKIGKLKMRREGAFWNAYYEEDGKENVFIGGIATVFTDVSQRRRNQFTEVIQDCFADLVREKFGIVIEFGEPLATGGDDAL